MAVIIVPTIEDTNLSYINTVKLVFSTIQITGDTWAAAKERLGEALYEEGHTAVTMRISRIDYETGMYALYLKESEARAVEWYDKEGNLKYRVIYDLQGGETWFDKDGNVIDPPVFNPGTVTEKTFVYNVDPGIASPKNHILFFSGSDQDLVLQASHILGSDEIPLQNLNTLSLKVTMSDPGAVSGTLRSNFLDGTELGDEMLINFTEHVLKADINGVSSHPSHGAEATVHPYLYKTGKDGETDTILRSSVYYYLNTRKIKNIFKKAGRADPRTLYVPGDDSDFCFSFGNGNRKYAFQMAFYLDKPTILQQVRAALAKVKIPRASTYELPDETCLGFNSRSGAFLYYYDLDVLKSGYFLAVIIGCNGYARVNIYIAKMLLPPAIDSAGMLSSTYADVPRYELDLHGMRLKINFWYNRLYFVLSYYKPDSIAGNREREYEAKRFLYSVYPDAIDKTIQPRPAKAGVTGNIDGDGTCADICVYYPLEDAEGGIIDEAQENNHNTRMERLFDDNPLTGEPGFDKVYMLEFSDLGDVLVNLDFDPKTKVFTQKFFNIFGTYSSNAIKKYTKDGETQSANNIFNHYDFEGRLLNNAGMTSPYDQNTLDSLGGLYTTSAQQIKYLIENNYLVIYAGSAFSIGYSQYNNNYLILFKCNVDPESQMPIDRVRRTIAGETGQFRICGDFLLRMDGKGRFSKCEQVDGSPVKSVKAKLQEQGLQELEFYIPQSDSSMFCGAYVADIIAADRNVVVLEDTESHCAYRY